MTGVRIEIRPEGIDEALAALGQAAARAEKPRDMWDDVGGALATSTRYRFETETDPEGNPWAPSLRKLVAGGHTLTMNSHLVSSITHEPSDTGVAVGTNIPYARPHQEGMTIRAKTSKGLRFRSLGNGGWVTKPEVTLPRRAFLGLDEDDKAEIMSIAGDWLTEPLGGADAGR